MKLIVLDDFGITYYKNYLTQLFKCCDIDIRNACGEHLEQLPFPDSTRPKFSSAPSFFDKQSLERIYNEEKWRTKPEYFSVYHCALRFAVFYIDKTTFYDEGYMRGIREREEIYKQLLKGEYTPAIQSQNDEYDGSDESSFFAEQLKSDLAEAEEEINQLRKEGCYSPYIDEYGRQFASSTHRYLVKLKDSQSTDYVYKWKKVSYWLQSDLDRVIYQYEMLQHSLKREEGL